MPIARFISFLSLTLAFTYIHGQSTEQLVSDIRTEFKRLNTKASLRIIKLENEEFLEQMTDGGGEVTGYLLSLQNG